MDMVGMDLDVIDNDTSEFVVFRGINCHIVDFDQYLLCWVLDGVLDNSIRSGVSNLGWFGFEAFSLHLDYPFETLENYALKGSKSQFVENKLFQKSDVYTEYKH